MLLYGYHPVREALNHRASDVERVLLASGRGGDRRRQIETLCQRHGIRVENVSTERLDALAGSGHNGVAAEVRASAQTLEEGSDPSFIVLVEDVQDPRNLGALLRVCEGAGVGRVLVRDKGSAPLTAAAVKTSAGAAEWLPVERVTNTVQTLDRYKSQGYWTYGAAPGGKPPWEADLTGPVVLCFGGEEKGLRQRTREEVDVLVGLPMRGRVSSLNLATAAAAVLYEAVRQRELASRKKSG